MHYEAGRISSISFVFVAGPRVLLRHSFQLYFLLPSVSSSSMSLQQNPIIISNADNLLTWIQRDPILCIIWLFLRWVCFSFSKLQKREVVYLFFRHECPILSMQHVILRQFFDSSFAYYIFCIKCEQCLSDSTYPVSAWMLHCVCGCWLKGWSQNFTSKSLFKQNTD